jgi:hypothetical protein
MQANGGNGGNGDAGREMAKAVASSEPPPRLPSINDPGAPKLVSSMGVVA